MSRFDVLRLPAFRLFFVAQLGSALGDFMVAPALAFAILDRTGSPGDIGLVLAARTIPVVLFMLLGGVVADRWPRHRVMFGADAVRVVSQGITAALVLSGDARIWQLMALQAVHGTASALFTPAVTGLVGQVVDAERRHSANALRSMTHSAAMITGPLLSTLLIVTVGSGWAIAADAATFAVSAFCLARIHLPPTPARPTDARNMLVELKLGWREFRSRTWVWSVILMASLTNMMYAVFTVLGPVLSKRELGSPGAWGAILAAFGLGAVTGSASALWLRVRHPLRTGVLSLTLFAAPPLVMSATDSAVIAGAAAFLGGMALMFFNPLWETTLQKEIPGDKLSRVSAYEWFGSYAAQPVGLALAGPVAAATSVRFTLFAAGATQLVVCLATLAGRDVRAYRAADHQAEGADHQTEGRERTTQ
ncbi:MFS transporter [Streptomyces camelliae]|uniref:MFS transporter n=1 Tax=Streptomyces camelliae TaxID=3004093 RepID=A0ABY7P625_9ACTN|nr:MFS transporter [Streptomyces sp. HUAS 2-6]WBO65132.1 MFS transporter [Streptomyces sp. HUAS 2-6]